MAASDRDCTSRPDPPGVTAFCWKSSKVKVTVLWNLSRLAAVIRGPTVSITSGPWAALGKICVGAAVVVLPDWSIAVAVIV